MAVDINGYPMSPIAASANVSVIVSQSSSATMLQDADIDAIKATVDSMQSDLEVAHGTGSWEGTIEYEAK